MYLCSTWLSVCMYHLRVKDSKDVCMCYDDVQTGFEKMHPVLSVLSYLLKAPAVPAGTPVVNALAAQVKLSVCMYVLYVCICMYVYVCMYVTAARWTLLITVYCTVYMCEGGCHLCMYVCMYSTLMSRYINFCYCTPTILSMPTMYVCARFNVCM